MVALGTEVETLSSDLGRTRFSGTSAAAPFITGIIAILLGETQEGLTTQEIKQKLKAMSS